MNDQPLEHLSSSWTNINPDLVEDPVKAAHLGIVEEAWREKAKEFEDLGNPGFKAMVAEYAGPRAVEEVAQAYDAGDTNKLENPHLPSKERGTLNL